MCNLAVNVFSEYTPVAGYGGEPLFTLKNSGAIFTQRTLSLMMPFVAFRHQEHGNGVLFIFSKQAFNDLSEGAIAEKLGWPTKAEADIGSYQQYDRQLVLAWGTDAGTGQLAFSALLANVAILKVVCARCAEGPCPLGQ